MYRAHLHLYPHALNHPKSSTVPGAFPSASVNSDNNAEFARTIQLTTDKPTQPIGRSSRNEAKGLFAAKNNGFFESPVMSRTHAEVKMVLEPNRKLIIRDTNSMHGTYVNGLQLHHEETAELQDGTEITFGADVTRGEEVFPAKTFRVGVNWQRLHRLSEQSTMTKPRTGYGVSSPDLMNSEYDSNEEDDDEEYDEDGEHHSDDEKMTASSGRSSPPAASTHSPDAMTRDEYAGYRCRQRSEIKFLGEVYDTKASKLKQILERPEVICIDDEGESSNKPEKSRPRMPSIPSLVNKPQAEDSSSAKKPTVETITEEESELKIIEKPAIFNQKVGLQSVKKGGASQPICVDDDDSEDENTEYLMDAESGEESGEEGESIDMNDEDDMDEELEEDDTMENEKFAPKEQKANDTEEKTGLAKNPSIDMPKSSKFQKSSMVGSEPTSPPDVMSSRLSELLWPDTNMVMDGSVPKNSREVPSLPPLENFTQPVSTTRSTTGGYHTHWAGINSSSSANAGTPLKPYMASKRDYFDARAGNIAALNEHLRSRLTANITSWNENRPSLKQWPEYYGQPPASKPTDMVVGQDAYSSIASSSGLYAHSRVGELLEVSKAVDKEASKITDKELAETCEKLVRETPAHDMVDSLEEEEEEEESTDEEGYVHTDVFGDDEMAYCEADSDEDSEEVPEKKSIETKSVDETKWPYGKLSINDMMNHESPKLKTSANSSAPFASPPPSEKSAEGSPVASEKTKSGTGLDNILNPEAASGSGLKRKHAQISHVEIPTPSDLLRSDYPVLKEDIEVGDAPEVVSLPMLGLFPELAGQPEVLQSVSESPEVSESLEVSEVSEVEERASKRAKIERTSRSGGIVKMAAVAMAGAVVGGVGVFAALVASAQ